MHIPLPFQQKAGKWASKTIPARFRTGKILFFDCDIMPTMNRLESELECRGCKEKLKITTLCPPPLPGGDFGAASYPAPCPNCGFPNTAINQVSEIAYDDEKKYICDVEHDGKTHRIYALKITERNPEATIYVYESTNPGEPIYRMSCITKAEYEKAIEQARARVGF